MRCLRAGPVGESLRYRMEAFYSFDGHVNDPRGNNLAAVNTPTYAAMKVSQGIVLAQASSQYAWIADNAALSFGDEDFTLAGWLQSAALAGNERWAIGKWLTTGNQRGYGIRVSAAEAIEFLVSSGGADATVRGATTYGALATGTAVFVAAWHDAAANTLNIQVNNGTVDSTSYSLGVLDSTGRFVVGARNDGAAAFFDGRLDAWGVWRRVLTASERTRLYRAGNGWQAPFR